jgi:HAD superfamily hydrolase (TIGR01509 family)
MTIKAVIFDMDGVLVDAREWHFEALNRALDLFGYHISTEDHLASFDGLPTHAKLEILSTDHGLPRGLHAFINHLKQLYTIEIVHSRCKPRFAHEYALSRLKREGMTLAVASNSIRPTVDLMMDKTGLDRYLDVQVAATDVSKSKPDPEIYFVTCERLGLDPSECLVVEDSQFGIASARAAGANLLIVEGVEDVTYFAIAERIRELESEVSR